MIARTVSLGTIRANVGGAGKAVHTNMSLMKVKALWAKARWCLLLALQVCHFHSLFAACPAFPPGITCHCEERSSTELVITCNTAPVANVTELIKANGSESLVVEMTMVQPVDEALARDTFLDFTSLSSLTIVFAATLTQIEPGAFNSLTQLQVLDLRVNSLGNLTEESFQGIGTSLETLNLDSNGIEHLGQDLEDFFSTVQSEITLRSNDLVCDCDLYWLVEFIKLRAANDSGPTVSDAECAGTNTAIDDPSVDYSGCIDLCAEGLHSCHRNATCVWNQMSSNVTCTCLNGYVGNGTMCVPVCQSELNTCHQNATCEWSSTEEQVICRCVPGFIGTGLTCELPVSTSESQPQSSVSMHSPYLHPLATPSARETTTIFEMYTTAVVTMPCTGLCDNSTTAKKEEISTTAVVALSFAGAILLLLIVSTTVTITVFMCYGYIWGKSRAKVSPLFEESGPPLLPMEAKASALDVTVPSSTSTASDNSTHL